MKNIIVIRKECEMKNAIHKIYIKLQEIKEAKDTKCKNNSQRDRFFFKKKSKYRYPLKKKKSKISED